MKIDPLGQLRKTYAGPHPLSPPFHSSFSCKFQAGVDLIAAAFRLGFSPVAARVLSSCSDLCNECPREFHGP